MGFYLKEKKPEVKVVLADPQVILKMIVLLFIYLLPARASEQGNVIGLVSVYIYIYVYIYILYIYVIKKKL